ncbi:MAG TPA: heme-copper oxidase subunit III [Bacteroidia bacterium]|jgi:cytochrome c oxidase subunit 3|nr:heme-copper oxidase subunit III [Bacteroidia bacterium]
MEAQVMENTNTSAKGIKEKAVKMLLWIGLVSIGMMFAGLTSGYIVRRGSGTWLLFQIPFPFYISTAIILVSSITMNMAMQAAKKGVSSGISRALLLTWILGVAFGVCQFMGYKALVDAKVFLVGTNSNASGSYFYILSLLHLCHIVGGLVALSIAFVKSVKRKYTTESYLGVKLCATYWHFLDGLWVYLFVFMLLYR